MFQFNNVDPVPQLEDRFPPLQSTETEANKEDRLTIFPIIPLPPALYAPRISDYSFPPE